MTDPSPDPAPRESPESQHAGDVPPSAAALTDPTSTPPKSQAARIPPTRRDPWAHRRGEPRLFAFLWSLFLFAATLTTFGGAAAGGVLSHDTLRPAARTLMVIIATGLSLAWPLVRLSQVRDSKPLLGSLQDALVILVPLHAVVWPQVLWWLAHWSPRIVAALAGMLSAWTFLIAGLIVLAQLSTQPSSMTTLPQPIRARNTWMLFFLILALVGALPALFETTQRIGDVIPPAFNAAWMTSPITAALEITRDRSWSGRPAAITASHWVSIAILAAIAGLVWVLAGIRSRRYSSRVRLSDAAQSPP